MAKRKDNRSDINADDLRKAIILYLQKENVSVHEFGPKVGLTRFPVSKFLYGETGIPRDVGKLVSELTSAGYWPIEQAKNVTYESFAQFAQKGSAQPETPPQISGVYRCFQWSETHYGKVTVSQVTIEDQKMQSYWEVEESQWHKQKKKGEIYNGVCMLSKQLVFILKERTTHQIKFIICDTVSDTVISGIFLKSSDQKPLHVSNIYMKKTESEVSADIVFESDIEDRDVRDCLEEPITSFNLDNTIGPQKNARFDLMKAMIPFVIPKDDGNSH